MTPSERPRPPQGKGDGRPRSGKPNGMRRPRPSRLQSDKTPRPSQPRKAQSERRSARQPSSEETLSREWLAELRNISKPGAFEQARDLTEKAIEAYEGGDFDAAARFGEQAKLRASRSALLRELLGLCYYHSSRWQEAARELLTYRRFTGRLDQNHVIGDCYRALGRPDRAIEVCSEVKRGDVSDEIWAEVNIVAASAHADKGEIGRAIARIDKSETSPQKVEPHHLRVLYVKADLLEQAGRAADARSIWETIYAEDPAFFDVADRIAPG